MNINPINFTSSGRDYKRELPEKYLYPPKFNLKKKYLSPLIEEEKLEPKISIDYLGKISKIKGQIKTLEEAEEKALSKIKAQQQEIIDDAIQKISALNQQKAEIQRQTSKLIFELEGTLRTLVTEELK